ncbi:serine hydrolase domain-containing protein [Streptosporangium sp. NPDC049376]|uniref:serine hydrolase domain-containing protein n=1 Tax=Streptosporangium sp. NPDC049376 TaxID=3366192 RepID=UPI003790F90E
MLEGLSQHCAQALTTHGCASVSVAVAHRDRVVFAEAYGLADVARGVAATPDTVYSIASVTKPITATAVCVAADRGLLNLDDPVEKYLSGFRLPRYRDYSEPTLRQVLQHRAGFGGHYDFAYAGLPAIRHGVEHYSTLYREPGSRFEYSNLGYGVLDAVLEKATGRSAADFTAEQVFAPLGLNACQIGLSYEGERPRALRYSADGRPYPDYDTTHHGASLGWASASDLAMFGLLQAGGPGVLKPETAAATRTALPITAEQGYGLGWFVSRGGPHQVVAHSGGMGGVSAMLAVVPELELSICVLANQTGGEVRTSVVNRVMAELVPDHPSASLPPSFLPERAVAVPQGLWEGHVRTEEGSVPLLLRVLPDSGAEVGLDGGPMVPADVVAASDDWDLRVSAPLQLPTEDARVNSPRLVLELNARHGHLVGAARAMKNGEGDGWLGNCLSHWCEATEA